MQIRRFYERTVKITAKMRPHVPHSAKDYKQLYCYEELVASLLRSNIKCSLLNFIIIRNIRNSAKICKIIHPDKP